MAGPDIPGESKNYQRFEIGNRSPTLAVIESVARYRDTDALSLPPLAYHVDPEALDEVIASTHDGVVRFEYDEVDVEIAGSGEIIVAERVL